MKYSTKNATITTRSEIINPCIIGVIPEFFNSKILVLSPIAPRDATIKNLLRLLAKIEKVDGIIPKLFKTDSNKNPTINHGINEINEIESKQFEEVENVEPAFCASFRFTFILIREKIITTGIIESVLVSFTIVAKSPADSLKA